MTMNTDKDWLRKKAQQEDGCFVSAGGLVEALAEREQALAERDRRRRMLRSVIAGSLWSSSQRRSMSISLTLVKIEMEEHYKPALGAVHKTAEVLKV